MKKCKNCNLPETYETIVFKDDSCNLCDERSEYENIDWDLRNKELKKLLDKYRKNSGYDCIIPYSGGKDSTFQVHYAIKELNLKPLVVRFNHGFMRPNINSNSERF